MRSTRAAASPSVRVRVADLRADRSATLWPVKALLTAAALIPMAIGSGCSSGTDDAAGAPEIAAGPGGGVVSRSYAAEDAPAELGGIVSSAAVDLAERLEVEDSVVGVAAIEEVIWTDSSYGCPIANRSYVPGEADGLRIVLMVDGELFEYRLAGTLEPQFCDPVAGLSTSPLGAELDGQGDSTNSDADQPQQNDGDQSDDNVDSPDEHQSDAPADLGVTPTSVKETEPTEGLNPPDE